MKPYFIFFLLIINLSLFGQEYQLETVIQRGHRASIHSVAFSPDGNFIATGSRDQTIKLWEIKTGREIRSFLGHINTVTTLAFDPSGKYLASGSYDKTIILWNIANGNEVKRLVGHEDVITSISFSPDGSKLTSGGYDWNAYLWDIETGTKELELKVNPDKGTGYGIDIQFNRKGDQLIIGGDNGMAIRYDIKKGLRLDTLRNLELGWCGGCPTLLSTSGESNTLLTTSNKGKVTLWNLKEGKKTHDYGITDREYKGIGYMDNLVVAATVDSIFVWNRSGKQINAFKAHDEEINKAEISPDGKYLATVSDDNTGIIWDIRTGKIKRRLSGFLNLKNEDGLDLNPNSYWDFNISRYLNYRNQFEISPDDQYIVMGKAGTVARMWELSSGRVIREFKGHEKVVICSKFTSDGNYLVTGGGDNRAILWNAKTGEIVRKFEGHSEMVFSLAISKNGKYLVTGGWDAKAILWDITTGERLKTYDFPNNSPYSLQFIQNDLYLAVAGLDKSLNVIELDTGLPARTLVGHTEIVSGLETSESTILSSGWDGNAKIWDLGTGLATQKFSGHKGRIYDASFSKDENWVITAGQDRTAKLWDKKTGKLIKTFVGHQDEVTCVMFIKNDKYLVTNSLDGTTRVWDIETGNEIVTHILIGEHDWLVKTNMGFFDATEGAKKNIYFVKGLKSYSLDQFFEDFYKPGIMNESLQNRGLLNYNYNILKKLEESPPPSIEIISPLQGDLLTKKEIDLVLKVSNNGGGIDEIKVLHNGKRVSNPDQSSPRGTKKSIYQTFPLQLIVGQNSIEVSSFSQGRIESEPTSLDLIIEGIPEDITCHVIAIGINEYKNPSLNLNYAYEDADSFYKLVKQKGKKLFNKIAFYPLFNREATRENILESLDQVAESANPQDVFFFYYAGHGSMVDGNFYFIPTENIRLYDSEELKNHAIYAGEIQQKFAKIKALKQMVLIDACQSGGSTELLAMRGASEEKAMAQLSRSSGVHVLAASGSEQFATEFKELGHGLFTYVLLEALEGKADGAPKDGKITIYELKSFIDDQVPEYSIKFKGKPQYPVTYSKGQDFPVVVE